MDWGLSLLKLGDLAYFDSFISLFPFRHASPEPSLRGTGTQAVIPNGKAPIPRFYSRRILLYCGASAEVSLYCPMGAN